MATRGLADAIDVGIAFLIYVAIGAVVSIVWDLFFSSRIEISKPPGWVSAAAIFVVLVVYLALGWGSAGRTLGKQLMGLRVVRADGAGLKPLNALWRAFLCAIFYPGLLLALAHRRNQSLQDLVCKTVVVYDWIPEADSSRVVPKAAPTSGVGVGGQPIA
jgi:uncharacterized RDD family membrane protein YckC